MIYTNRNELIQDALAAFGVLFAFCEGRIEDELVICLGLRVAISPANSSQRTFEYLVYRYHRYSLVIWHLYEN